jgi:hypothetical protein
LHKNLISLPAGSVARHVHEQGGEVMLWVETDMSAEGPFIFRTFSIEGTGCGFDTGSYIGTAHVDGMVWHVFEVLA